MLKLTKPGLRRSNVVLDSFGGCVADAPKEFSRAPKVSFSKVVSQPRMFFEKLKGEVAFKQLESFANAHGRGYLNKQMDMVNSDVKFINLESSSVSDLPQEKFTIHSEPVKLERVFDVFNFPHKVECVLSEAMLPGFQIHFLSPKSATRKRAHANLNVYFEEPSISAFPNSQTKELNLSGTAIPPCFKAVVSSPEM